MIMVYVNRNLDTEKPVKGPCEGGGRDWKDPIRSKECLGPPEVERDKETFPSNYSMGP